MRDLKPGDIGRINDWCLSVTGIQAGVINVTDPNGGEQKAIGTTVPITWTQSFLTGDVQIDLSPDGGTTWSTLGTAPAGAGTFDWAVTEPASTNALVRITSLTTPIIFDVSDGPFTIVPPLMQVIRPNGGETALGGRPFPILWNSVPGGGTVHIELSTDSGGSFTTIAAAAPNTGSFTWSPPFIITNTARIRITANSAPARTDTSDADFTISDFPLRLLFPNGGETFYTHTQQVIRWRAAGVVGNVKIELSRDVSRTDWTTIGTPPATAQQFLWTVAPPGTVDAMIRISDESDPTLNDQTDAVFTIKEMTVTVNSPNGGEVWGIGTPRQITWSTDGVTGNIDILHSQDGGATFTPIFTNIANDGSETWIAAGQPGPNNIIKVQAHDFPPFDVSNAVFALVNPAVEVVVPNGGEEFRVGQAHAIQWNSTGLIGDVLVELSRDDGASWVTLFGGTVVSAEGLNSINWTVTAPDTTTALIRVRSVSLPGVSDQSNAVFRIVTPRITVQSPNGGERFFMETVRAITWTSQGIDAATNVRIDLSRDNGTTFVPIVASTPNDGTANWTVSGPPTDEALIRITALDASGASDTSASTFEILDPSIRVITPNGGQEWLIGSLQPISWTSDGVEGTVDIEISRNNGASWTTLFAATANDGTEIWPVNGTPTTTARIRVKMTSRPAISDQSDRTFTISRAELRVTAPTAGTIAVIGRRLAIGWTGSVVRVGGGNVDIQISRNGGTSWTTIIADTANDGLVSWSLVTPPATTRAKIRVIWKPNPGVRGDSALFTIR